MGVAPLQRCVAALLALALLAAATVPAGAVPRDRADLEACVEACRLAAGSSRPAECPHQAAARRAAAPTAPVRIATPSECPSCCGALPSSAAGLELIANLPLSTLDPGAADAHGPKDRGPAFVCRRIVSGLGSRAPPSPAA
jgi:hypothetical protein